jgi:hypothetical protein
MSSFAVWVVWKTKKIRHDMHDFYIKKGAKDCFLDETDIQIEIFEAY